MALRLANPAAAVHWLEDDAVEYFDVPHMWSDAPRGSGTSARVFFETPRTLAAKYRWAGAAGLRGVGVWTTGYAPQGTNPSNVSTRAAFYDSLHSFTEGQEAALLG